MRNAAERRHFDAVHKKKLYRISQYSGYPGPWYSEAKGRVLNCGRGRRSKYLKRQSNRRLRRQKYFHGTDGYYKKVFDYWWELT